MPIQCPACGASNPDHSWQCACGHYFVTTLPKAPAAPSPKDQSSPLVSSIPPRTFRFWFRGDGSTLFGIYVVNLLLTLLTLGFYYFWGKVKVRQFLYGQTEFEGDRFGYHGTGKELLIGWVKAFIVLGVLVGLLFAVQSVSPEAGALLSNLVSIFFYMILIPVAIVGSRRYRLSRTSWRGIRFSFRGGIGELINIFIRGSILTGITLGIYYPYFQHFLRQFLVNNVYYGNRGLHYDGEAKPLWRIYALGIFLTIFTLGVYYFWFSASKARYYWEHTTFGGSRGRSTVTGWKLFKLKLGNFFLIILTLGIGYPWAAVRSSRFQAENILLEGTLDLEAIQQEALAASATGEGLTDILDLGVLDIDLGF